MSFAFFSLFSQTRFCSFRAPRWVLFVSQQLMPISEDESQAILRFYSDLGQWLYNLVGPLLTMICCNLGIAYIFVNKNKNKEGIA